MIQIYLRYCDNSRLTIVNRKYLIQKYSFFFSRRSVVEEVEKQKKLPNCYPKIIGWNHIKQIKYVNKYTISELNEKSMTQYHYFLI